MADLKEIFGGGFEPSNVIRALPIGSPTEQVLDAIKQSGFIPPRDIAFDGKVHRFDVDKAGDKAGWYCLFSDGVPAGRFGNWKTGVDVTWHANLGRKLTAVEEMANAKRMAEAKAAREAEQKKRHEVAADSVNTIWENCIEASPEHPYLQRKGVAPHGARVTGDGRLVVPLYDQDDTIASLQYISADGSKLYHLGGKTSGCFWQIGAWEGHGTIYIAEGFATAATIHEATGRPCVVAYSASNLVPVTAQVREMHGHMTDLVIVADNDASGVGQKYADQASAKYGARVVMPTIEGDANDYAQAGHDLALLLQPPIDDWLIPAMEFSSKPAPISWMVKGWLQDKALVMVHGPSGGGKTFVVLDWCLHMAASVPTWGEIKVKAGNVVYLAGEGHYGLKGRIAAWRQKHSPADLTMWLSKDGCDLNTSGGYTRIVDNIRMLPSGPALIVVDTLHRFLNGDENSAQDAKSMLDACNALMREFDCSVLLVHHTGVSEEAQHRARGSSAWRGALDIEISVIPARDGQPIQIVQRKSKDAEIAKPVYVELQQVTINGWIDEDDQPVTSAVISHTEAPTAPKKESKVDGHRKVFENAWWASGADQRGDLPYLSRSALRAKLMADGRKERTIENDMSASYPDKLIGALIAAEIIAPSDHGWVVINPIHGSSMIMRNMSPKPPKSP
jgi:phage/plasmid primase-like uncharacterized protein